LPGSLVPHEGSLFLISSYEQAANQLTNKLLH